MYDWDEAKRQTNLAKHGVDFTDVERFDWTRATHEVDTRRDYGEPRIVSTGDIDGRLFIAAWTERAGHIRLISLRKANDREQRAYHRVRAADR